MQDTVIALISFAIKFNPDVEEFGDFSSLIADFVFERRTFHVRGRIFGDLKPELTTVEAWSKEIEQSGPHAWSLTPREGRPPGPLLLDLVGQH